MLRGVGDCTLEEFGYNGGMADRKQEQLDLLAKKALEHDKRFDEHGEQIKVLQSSVDEMKDQVLKKRVHFALHFAGAKRMPKQAPFAPARLQS